MRLIKSYEEYKEYIDRIRLGGCVSNCYFLLNQIKCLVECKKLYLEDDGTNLYLFVKEESFYRFYYFVRDFSRIIKLELDMPAVVEFLFKEQLSEKQNAEVHLIEQTGFVLGRESGRMFLGADKVKVSSSFEYEEGIKIRYAESNSAGEIYEILRNNFNPLYAFIPNLIEIEKLIDEKRILVLYCENRIAGVLHMELSKKTAWIHHIVILEEFRGKGFGTMLLNEYHGIMKDNALSFSHWVDLQNVAAINMYARSGYELDGRRANEYVYR